MIEQREIVKPDREAYDGLIVREEGWAHCVERTLARLFQLRGTDLIGVVGLWGIYMAMRLDLPNQSMQLAGIGAMTVVVVLGQVLAWRGKWPAPPKTRRRHG